MRRERETHCSPIDRLIEQNIEIIDCTRRTDRRYLGVDIMLVSSALELIRGAMANAAIAEDGC